MEGKELIMCRDAGELSQRAAELFVALAKEAVAATGRFTVALSGGSTPKALFSLLVSDWFLPRVAWSKVYLFWGDERCVPPDHPDSNYGVARAAMLDKAPIPPQNVFPMPTESEDAERIAAEYQQTLREFFGLAEGGQPRFDLILLGMGEDGHTASLFPGTPALEETERLVTAHYVEKLRAHRITLTIATINQAASIVFLISGTSKASALREVLEGEYQPMRLPSQWIQPVNGKLFFMVDRDAGSELTGSEKEHE